MGFHIDPIVFSVRGGSNFKKYGDRYDFVLTMQSFNHLAFITLARGEMPKHDQEMFRKELIRMGFHFALWSRSSGKNLVWDLKSDKFEKL
jgi:hypothetical protein